MQTDSVSEQVIIKGICPVCSQMKLSFSDFQVLSHGGFVKCIYCGILILATENKIYIREAGDQYE